jgi:hypothetical protein
MQTSRTRSNALNSTCDTDANVTSGTNSSSRTATPLGPAFVDDDDDVAVVDAVVVVVVVVVADDDVRDSVSSGVGGRGKSRTSTTLAGVKAPRSIRNDLKQQKKKRCQHTQTFSLSHSLCFLIQCWNCRVARVENIGAMQSRALDNAGSHRRTIQRHRNRTIGVACTRRCRLSIVVVVVAIVVVVVGVAAVVIVVVGIGRIEADDVRLAGDNHLRQSIDVEQRRTTTTRSQTMRANDG